MSPGQTHQVFSFFKQWLSNSGVVEIVWDKRSNISPETRWRSCNSVGYLLLFFARTTRVSLNKYNILLQTNLSSFTLAKFSGGKKLFKQPNMIRTCLHKDSRPGVIHSLRRLHDLNSIEHERGIYYRPKFPAATQNKQNSVRYNSGRCLARYANVTRPVPHAM